MPLSKKEKQDINESISKMQDTLMIAKEENNTTLIKIIEKCLKALERKKDQ